MADDYATPGKRKTKKDLKKKKRRGVYKKGGKNRTDKRLNRPYFPVNSDFRRSTAKRFSAAMDIHAVRIFIAYPFGDFYL